jgi:hypothetical protein
MDQVYEGKLLLLVSSSSSIPLDLVGRSCDLEKRNTDDIFGKSRSDPKDAGYLQNASYLGQQDRFTAATC